MNLAKHPHNTHIERTIRMATEAAERGDRPCGSLLVRDGVVLNHDTNRVYTDDDLAFHPELSLARWADRELTADERAETVLYTTVEPCSMCATAIALTELGGVVFCVSGENYWKLAAKSHPTVPEDYIPCAEVFERLGRDIPCIGSVLESDGIEAIEPYLS